MEQPDAKVTADQVPALLLAAVPSLAEAWAEAAKEHAEPDSPTGRLDYLDAALAVEHLADCLANGNTREFDAAFDLIEHLITHGDAYVSELGVVGYLETMQMSTATSRGVDPDAFRTWLRPTSARYWEALNGYWQRGAPFPSAQPH